jgi:hypothetical protein
MARSDRPTRNDLATAEMLSQQLAAKGVPVTRMSRSQARKAVKSVRGRPAAPGFVDWLLGRK